MAESVGMAKDWKGGIAMVKGNVVQDKNGKLFVVLSKIGKHQLELKEVKQIRLQMDCDPSSVSMVVHHSDYELARAAIVPLDQSKPLVQLN